MFNCFISDNLELAVSTFLCVIYVDAAKAVDWDACRTAHMWVLNEL